MSEKWKRAVSFRKPDCTWRASSRMFCLLFFYTGLIWCCELLDFLCWLAGLSQVTVLSRAAALLLAVFLSVRLVGLPDRERAGTDLFFWGASAFILLFFGIKGIRPDLSYDTQNYHLLSQIPGFVDNLHYHVIPGRFQMFGFRLGDRLFYPFRALLGLRMGTLFNAFAMVALYRQVMVFLAWFVRRLRASRETPKKTEQEGKMRRGEERPYKREAGCGTKLCRFRLISWPSVLAFLIVSRYELLQESGSYMVELAALPFLVEMVFLLVRDRDEKRTGREAFVFCLLGGFLFCLKMTNIVYLAPLVVLYLIRIRREVTPGLFAACLAAGALPVVIYLGYNGLTTGNPVYPYYNTLFQSPYYFDADFKDVRWGPQDGKEILLWPWYMIRYPDYRLSEFYCEYNLDLAVIWLAFLAAAAASLAAWAGRKKAGTGSSRGTEIREPELLLAALFLASLFLWTVTTGHIRYFMGGIILGGLAAGCVFLRATSSGKPLFLGLCLLLALLFAGRVPYGYSAVFKGREWAMRDANREAYRQNLPFIFRDRELFPPEVKEKIDRIFLTWGDYGSFARLAGESVPVWNRYSITNELSAFRESYETEITEAMARDEGVYDMIPQGAEVLEGYLQWTNEAGWYVEELFYLDSILRGVQSYTMVGLGLHPERENTWYYSSFETSDAESGPVFEKTGDHALLTATVGDPDSWLFPYPFEVEILASDGQTEKTAAVVRVGEKPYEQMEVPLDLTGLEGSIRLQFRSREETKRAIVINPRWETTWE